MTKTPGLYLNLFHGRNVVDEDMEDWGFDGPSIGPLDYAHVTYMSDLKLGCSKEAAEKFFPEQWAQFVESVAQGSPPSILEGTIDGCWLNINEDLVVYNGKFYGDWSLNYHA